MIGFLLFLFLCMVLARKGEIENPPERGSAREFWGF